MGKLSNAVIKLGSKVNGKAPKGKGLTAILEDFAKNYRLEVADVTALTTEQCEGLACGGVVVKNQNGNKHAYIVSYKEDGVGLCLTYTDCENVETVAYDKVGNDWVFNSKDVTHIGQ